MSAFGGRENSPGVMATDATLRRNTAPWDRTLRLVVGLAIAFFAPRVLPGGYGLVAAGVVAGLLLDAALTGYCPLYARLGLSTAVRPLR